MDFALYLDDVTVQPNIDEHDESDLGGEKVTSATSLENSSVTHAVFLARKK